MFKMVLKYKETKVTRRFIDKETFDARIKNLAAAGYKMSEHDDKIVLSKPEDGGMMVFVFFKEEIENV